MPATTTTAAATSRPNKPRAVRQGTRLDITGKTVRLHFAIRSGIPVILPGSLRLSVSEKIAS
jgi:hypothetical protein